MPEAELAASKSAKEFFAEVAKGLREALSNEDREAFQRLLQTKSIHRLVC